MANKDMKTLLAFLYLSQPAGQPWRNTLKQTSAGASSVDMSGDNLFWWQMRRWRWRSDKWRGVPRDLRARGDDQACITAGPTALSALAAVVGDLRLLAWTQCTQCFSFTAPTRHKKKGNFPTHLNFNLLKNFLQKIQIFGLKMPTLEEFRGKS